MLADRLAQRQSYTEIGRAFGLSKNQVYRRAKWWGLKTQRAAKHEPQVFVEIAGERMTLYRASQRLGIEYRVLIARWRRGWRGAELLRPRIRTKPTEYELGLSEKDWKAAAALADEIGTRHAANRLRLPYGAISAAQRGEWGKLG